MVAGKVCLQSGLGRPGRVSTAIKEPMNPRSSSEAIEPHSPRFLRDVVPVALIVREFRVTDTKRAAIC
jgi:hypothetical protein